MCNKNIKNILTSGLVVAILLIKGKQQTKLNGGITMKTKINSRKHGEITFFCQKSGGYVWADLNGKPGTLGNQICHGGNLSGSTCSYHGDEDGFDKFCRNWWKSYLRNERDMA